MFCPQCGSTQPDELNFCKACGANLGSVRTALDRPGKSEDFNWKGTWLAEAVMTRAEKDRLRGVTPEMKRTREIKAGVITASAGVGATVVIAVIMEGIIASGGASAAAIAILSRVWIAGLIPILVGLALVFNGVFVSKRKSGSDQLEAGPDDAPVGSNPQYLSPQTETNQLRTGPFSVTEDTTRHLDGPRRDDPKVGV